ncbi:MAG: ComF family protein [Planctomycetes bacterium]|nr:ComF family protein [Planctomycetota bacterium]
MPIPLHWRRRWSRRYDQAQLLTRATQLALKQQNLSIPVNCDLLRIRHTAPQTSMAHSHRLQNLKGAFAVRSDAPLQGKHICLIDDVTTTGTTLRIAGRTLIKAGAAQVSAAVIAVAAND